MTFVVASYNVLADSYIRPSYYPHVAPRHLDPAWRRPALVRHIEQIGADVLCLQEVERPVLDAVLDALRPRGYEVEYVKKTGGKPDGCATLFKGFDRESGRSLAYGDGSGHVALLLRLRRGERVYGIANTHVKWASGTVQIEELVRNLDGSLETEPWIVCGDLNAEPGSELEQFMVARGFRDPFARDAYSCNANARRKKIDYIFCTEGLSPAPVALSAIMDETPLPSDEEPSDHLAIRATFSE